MSIDRARAYLAKFTVPSEGGRNDALNKAAFAILEHFNLAEQDYEDLLLEWARQTGLSDDESLKTIRSAWRGASGKGVIGSKAKADLKWKPSKPAKAVSFKPAPAKPKPVKKYDLREDELPPAIDDGARALLQAAFAEGEGVRICPARLDDSGHEVPKDAGLILSREEWLARLAKHDGNPNGIFKSSGKQPGIYIGVNPMRPGGGHDKDVTAYRHVLVEFDEGISLGEQWNLYQQSRIPCTAIIWSGGKSVHAWVRVDAADRREYDERVKLLYDHFAGYDLDVKNKNPSRFSRLPNCRRFENRQELLAVNAGAASFTEWMTEQSADAAGKVVSLADLMLFRPDNDTDSLLGRRWICKGGSCLLVAPSGVGKSSLAIQAAVHWARGQSFLGIPTSKRLKILVVQAENDDGDLAEMVQGVVAGMGLNTFEHEAEIAELNRMIVFVRDTTHTGDEFLACLHRLIDKHKPDLVILDPLLSFIGDDISRQSVVAAFFRNGLNPILEATGVAVLCVHHTGKPPNDKDARRGWTASDHSYAGVGSSDLVNWARAVIVLRAVDDHTFELKLPKRGKRAGATHPSGEPALSLWLQHAAEGIFWNQIDPPVEPEYQPKEKRAKKSKVEALADSDAEIHAVIMSIPDDGESARSLGARMAEMSQSIGKTLGETKCKTDLLDLLVKRSKLVFKSGKYYPGKTA